MRNAILGLAFSVPLTLMADEGGVAEFNELELRLAPRAGQIVSYEAVVFSPDNSRLAVSSHHRKSLLTWQADIDIVDLSGKGEEPKLVRLGDVDSTGFDKCVYYCWGAATAPAFSTDGSRLL